MVIGFVPEKKIMKKIHSGFLVVSLDEENVPTHSGSNLYVVGDEGVGDYDANDAESDTRSTLNVSFESDHIENNGEPPQEIPHPSDTIPHPLIQQDT